MTFLKGFKGQNGINKKRRRQGSQRRRLCTSKGTNKGTNKSPSVTPATLVTPSNADTIQLLTGGWSNPNMQRNLNGWFDIASSSATPAAPRQQPPRASKDRDSRVQFNVELNSDDESDSDAYVEHTQEITDEITRNHILYQYIGLGSPDPDEWDDYLEEKGTISQIEDASLSTIKSGDLFRRQIRRVLMKIRECWDNGVDYCPKADSSKAGRPAIINVNSTVANMIAPRNAFTKNSKTKGDMREPLRTITGQGNMNKYLDADSDVLKYCNKEVKNNSQGIKKAYNRHLGSKSCIKAREAAAKVASSSSASGGGAPGGGGVDDEDSDDVDSADELDEDTSMFREDNIDDASDGAADDEDSRHSKRSRK